MIRRIVQEIEAKSADGDYIFRGKPEHCLDGEQSPRLNAGNYKIVVDAPGEISETIDADARNWTLKVSGGLAKNRQGNRYLRERKCWGAKLFHLSTDVC